MSALETLNIGRRNGVSPSAMHTLLALLSDPPMKPSRIAAMTGITAAAVTGSMDRLELVGMIARLPVGNDRRVKAVTPTELAFRTFSKIIIEIES